MFLVADLRLFLIPDFEVFRAGPQKPRISIITVCPRHSYHVLSIRVILSMSCLVLHLGPFLNSNLPSLSPFGAAYWCICKSFYGHIVYSPL